MWEFSCGVGILARLHILRLYPPVAIFGREAKDSQIADYIIHRGTVIMISQWVMHRHPKYFNNPDAFQPKRWTEEFEKQLPRGVYISFGDDSPIIYRNAYTIIIRLSRKVTDE